MKTMMVASVALFALLTAHNDIVDYGSNYNFVRHTLAMDTTFPDNALRGRVLTSPVAWTLAYWLIILIEAVTGVVLAFAAWRPARGLRHPASFNAAKAYVVIGVGLGFLLWRRRSAST